MGYEFSARGPLRRRRLLLIIRIITREPAGLSVLTSHSSFLFDSIQGLKYCPSHPINSFVVDEGLELLGEYEVDESWACFVVHSNAAGMGGNDQPNIKIFGNQKWTCMGNLAIPYRESLSWGGGRVVTCPCMRHLTLSFTLTPKCTAHMHDSIRCFILCEPDDSQCHPGILQPYKQSRVLKTHTLMGKDTQGWASGPITYGSKSKMH